MDLQNASPMWVNLIQPTEGLNRRKDGVRENSLTVFKQEYWSSAAFELILIL